MTKIAKILLIITGLSFGGQALSVTVTDGDGNPLPSEHAFASSTLSVTSETPILGASSKIFEPEFALNTDFSILFDYSKGALFDSNPEVELTDLTDFLTNEGHTLEVSNLGILNHDLSAYDVLIFNAIYSKSAYPADEIAAIEAFVAAGGAVLIFGEAQGCTGCAQANENVSDISQALVGASTGVSSLTPTDYYFSMLSEHDFFDGVSQLYYRYGGGLTAASENTVIAKSDDELHNLIIAEDKVVVLGDSSFITSRLGSAYWDIADNNIFLKNVFDYLTASFDASISGCHSKNGSPLVNAIVKLKVVKFRQRAVRKTQTDEAVALCLQSLIHRFVTEQLLKSQNKS